MHDAVLTLNSNSLSRTRPALPRLHLVTFHQEILSIYDQIIFLGYAIRALGLSFTIGDRFDPDALNLMIENFLPHTCDVIRRFRRDTGKRISIFATEHLDRHDGRMLSYNDPLFAQETEWTYISHAERAVRFGGLIEASHYARFIFRQCEYPRLDGIAELFPRCPIVDLPPPPLPMTAVARRARHRRDQELVFTGSITPFRQEVLDDLGREIDIATSKIGLNYVQRMRAYVTAGAALNIPQYRGWIWSSPMRVLYGMAMGRLTISLFLEPGCDIDRFTVLPGAPSAKELRAIVDELTAEKTIERIAEYQAYAEACVAKAKDGLVEKFLEWGMAEGLA